MNTNISDTIYIVEFWNARHVARDMLSESHGTGQLIGEDESFYFEKIMSV